ncbi:hypothetical protein N7493_005491, partial [Penicillium malachiteum]
RERPRQPFRDVQEIQVQISGVQDIRFNDPESAQRTAERTGSPVLHTLWSYVSDKALGENL